MNKKKTFLFIAILLVNSLSYGLTLHNARVVEHKSWLSGKNDKGRAIEGHFIPDSKCCNINKEKNFKDCKSH